MIDSYSRSLSSDALYQYLGATIQLLSGAIFYISMVRMFGTKTVGAIALFVAVLGIFNVVFSFGLGNATQHFTSYNIGKGNFNSVRSTIYKLVFIGFLSGLAGFITLFYVSPFISTVFFHSNAYITLIRILSLILFGNVLLGVLNGALLGVQNFKASGLLNILVWSIYYFGSLIFAFFVRSMGSIVLGWIIGIFLGVGVGAIVVFKSVIKFSGSTTPVTTSLIFSFTVPILLSSIITYGANYIDRLVVAGMIGLTNLGVYNLALMVSSSVNVIVYPFSRILLPKFSELFGRGEQNSINERVRASSLLLVYFYTPIAIGIAALSGPVLNLLGGKIYAFGSFSLSIILFFSAAFITSNILFQAVASIRKTKVFIITSSVALSSNAIVSLALIPIFGIEGAALGLSSVFASTFIILYHFAKKLGLVKFDFVGIIKIWASAGLMYCAITAMKYYSELHNIFAVFSLPLYVLMGMVIYLGGTKLLKVFNRSDKELVRSLIPKKFFKFQNLLDFLI